MILMSLSRLIQALGHILSFVVTHNGLGCIRVQCDLPVWSLALAVSARLVQVLDIWLCVLLVILVTDELTNHSTKNVNTNST